jgi:hypothetical protein
MKAHTNMRKFVSDLIRQLLRGHGSKPTYEMPAEVLDAITKMQRATLYKLLQLQARCDALDAVVDALASKAGVTDNVRDSLERVASAYLQTYLERVEKLSPEQAAQIDMRGPHPKIDATLLELFRKPIM